MRLLVKDLKQMNLYKPTQKKDSDGDISNVYDDVHSIFMGNIQPYSQDSNKADYGLDLRYAYAVLTQDGATFKELDRIGFDSPQYEIKVVMRWANYKRLLVEEVR